MSSHSRPHPAPAPSYQRAAGCLSTSDDSHGRILQNAGASKIEPEEGGGQSPPPPSHPPTPTPCTAPSPFPPHLHCLLLISGMGWGMESWEEDGSKKPGPSGVAGVSEVSLLPPSAEWEQLGGVLCGQPWLGSCPHSSPCIPVWPPGLFLPRPARQPGVPLLTEGWLFLPPGWMLYSQAPAPDPGPLQDAQAEWSPGEK